MRLYNNEIDNGEPVPVDVRWKDHAPKCEKCREVNIEQSATFAKACAQGAPLLMEEMKKLQAPVERKRREAETKWAKERKTFVIDRPSADYIKKITKYVDSNEAA